jgi:hypothetical protein
MDNIDRWFLGFAGGVLITAALSVIAADPIGNLIGISLLIVVGLGCVGFAMSGD